MREPLSVFEGKRRKKTREKIKKINQNQTKKKKPPPNSKPTRKIKNMSLDMENILRGTFSKPKTCKVLKQLQK